VTPPRRCQISHHSSLQTRASLHNTMDDKPSPREGVPATEVLPPGTVRLIDTTGQQNSKHAEGKGLQDIILVPSPSEDPEDPLNWTFKRKLLATSCIVVYTIAAAYPSSAVYSVVTPIRKGTSLTLTDINNGTGIMVRHALNSSSRSCDVVVQCLTLMHSFSSMAGAVSSGKPWPCNMANDRSISSPFLPTSSSWHALLSVLQLARIWQTAFCSDSSVAPSNR
jgi:hypothetical protein